VQRNLSSLLLLSGTLQVEMMPSEITHSWFKAYQTCNGL